jgi:hypothetical protein
MIAIQIKPDGRQLVEPGTLSSHEYDVTLLIHGSKDI